MNIQGIFRKATQSERQNFTDSGWKQRYFGTKLAEVKSTLDMGKDHIFPKIPGRMSGLRKKSLT